MNRNPRRCVPGLSVVLMFLAMGPGARAETYYVSQKQPGAADTNPGTLAQPWLTLSKAAAVAVAGDTVNIKVGVYQETLSPKNSGTPGKPITFQAFGDEPVFITCPKYKITGWQKVAGTQKVYEANSPVDWPAGVMGVKTPLVAVDGKALPGPGAQWSLGVPGLKKVTDEPHIFQGESKVSIPRYCALGEDNKIRLNLGGEDPNKHEVQATPKKFYGVEIKTDHVVVRGLTVVDVSAGFQVDGKFCLIESCIARDVWGDFVSESGFAAGAGQNHLRRCTAINCFRTGISIGEGGMIEECLVIGSGTRVPYRVAQEDTLGAPGWEWGTGWRTGTHSVGRYNVAAGNSHFGWWIDIKQLGGMIYGNVITGSDTGIYNEAMCNDTKLLYNSVVNCGNGFVWRACKRIWGQFNYVAENKVGVGVWGWFQAPTPTTNVFRQNLILRSSKEALRTNRWSHCEDLTGNDAASTSAQVGTEGPGPASYVDRSTHDWDLFEDNFYTVQPGGVFTREIETAVPYYPAPKVTREYRTLAEYQAATGRERGSEEREVGMEQFGLGLYTIRIPHSSTPHLAVPIVGNPVEKAIHVDPMEAYQDETPYFWRPSAKPHGTALPSPWVLGNAGPGFELRWSRRPFLKDGGPRLKLDVPAVVWLTATGKGAAAAEAEAGGWWSPSLPTVPGAKISFSFLVDGKDLKAPTMDTVVAWIRFSSLTDQNVSRQFLAGKNDAGQMVESGPCQGSFSWRKISGIVTAPEKAERFEVFFGLRPCEGRARFAGINLQTEAGEAPTEDPAALPPVPLNMEAEVLKFIGTQG